MLVCEAPSRKAAGFTSGTILITVLVPHLQELGFPPCADIFTAFALFPFASPRPFFFWVHDGVLEDRNFIFISIVRCPILTKKGNAVHNDCVDEAEDWMMSAEDDEANLKIDHVSNLFKFAPEKGQRDRVWLLMMGQ